MDRTKFLMEQFGLTKRPNPTYKQYFTFGELQKLLINYEKAINYSRCCERDSDQLCGEGGSKTCKEVYKSGLCKECYDIMNS